MGFSSYRAALKEKIKPRSVMSRKFRPLQSLLYLTSRGICWISVNYIVKKHSGGYFAVLVLRTVKIKASSSEAKLRADVNVKIYRIII